MKVFISYRRDDAAGHAGRLADALVARYGADAVFIDVETIGAGEDFVEAIDRALSTADAALIVIGPGWLRAERTDGGRRLDNPKDFVRLEVEAALRSGLRTIPVLVGGASMPAPDELPPTLVSLPRLNAAELVDRRFHADLESLLDDLEGRSIRPDRRTTHLPPQPTPFVGRTSELTAVRDLLGRDDVRLVTLTGPGGTGKTRLAIEVGTTLSDRYPEGIWFVGLAALRDPDLVAATIATTLGLREGPGSTPQQTIERHLRNRRVLLVVDNVEQLLPEAASLLGDLLVAGPAIEMVVSSRESLMIRAEHVYPVYELETEDAVTLFLERARAAGADIEPDAASRTSIDAICARLEGLPLAIELTASRLKLLSPTEVLARLDARLPMLIGGARDAPERQRTMRATIAWSYDLLAEDERRLFARLAVFVGGCSLDAAEAICGADIETAGSLVDKSLLRRVERSGGQTRYVSLETIQEYALERLAELPEAPELHHRHAEHFLALAKEALPGLKGSEQDVWIERLESEHDNFRGALRWSLDAGDRATALDLAATLWLFWYMRGHVSEGRAWLNESLAGVDRTPSVATALALAGAGWLAGEQGADETRELLEAALRCSTEAEPTTSALILSFLSGCLPEDPARARALSERSVSVAREADDRWMSAIAMNNLAELYREDGDNERATALYEESYRIAREIGNHFHVALYMSNLAEMAFLAGDVARAQGLLSEVVEITTARGDRRHLSIALLDLGWVSLAEGRYEASSEHFREALPVLRGLGGLPLSVSALRGLAAVAAVHGDDTRAGRLEGAADELEAHVGVLPTPPDAGAHMLHLAAARARAGDGWAVFRDEGRLMDLDQALEYAMQAGPLGITTVGLQP